MTGQDKKRAGPARDIFQADFQAIINAVSDAILVHDGATGEIVEVNRGMCEMFNYTPEEARQLKVTALCGGKPGSQMESVRSVLAKAAAGSPQVFEWQVRDRTGRFFWVEVHLKPLRFGGCDRVLAVLRDITERKQVEDIRRQAYEELEHLVAERTAGLQSANAQLRREIEERRRTEAIVRLQRDLALSLSGKVGLHESLRLCLKTAITISGLDSGGVYLVDPASGNLDLVYHQGLSLEFVQRVAHYEADDLNTYIIMAVRPVYAHIQDLPGILDEEGMKEGLRSATIIPVIHQDRVIASINVASHQFEEVPATARAALETLAAQVGSAIARVQAEEDLRRAKEDLEIRVAERTAQLQQQAELIQDLYNNAPCGYHSLDPDGTFVQINNTELHWLGYTRDEVVGRMKFSDLLTADGLKIFQELFPDFIERGWVGGLEYDLVRKDGTMLPVLLNATAITDDAGKYLMSRGTIFDISDRKRAENAVKESEKRLRYLASQLLTAQEDERKRIARDLHEDLGQSLTVLIMRMWLLHRCFPAEMSEAKAESEALLNYVNEIIEKVRAISYNLRPLVLDLGLTTALNSLVQEFPIDQNIELSLDLCDMDGLFSAEEEIGIYRVFQEALTNTFKHARATRIVITAKREEGLVAFQIDDNGQGFDLEEVQGRGAQERRLGLATMEERVRLLGGSLKISSVRGTGTSVAFTIPISPLQKTVE